MRLPSLKTGRWEHFDGKNAPSVPKSGTEGALWPEKCAFRPKIRDRGSTLTGKMCLPSLNPGQREHLGQKNAPSVPKSGTEGALWPEKCAFRPKKRDRGSTMARKMRLPSQNPGQKAHYFKNRQRGTLFFLLPHRFEGEDYAYQGYEYNSAPDEIWSIAADILACRNRVTVRKDDLVSQIYGVCIPL